MPWPTPDPVIRPDSSRFNWLLWGFLLLLMMFSGGVIALLSWPDGTPASGFQFWFMVAGFPVIAYTLALGLYLDRRSAVWVKYEAEEQERQRLAALWDVWARKRVPIMAAAAFVPDAGEVKKWFDDADALPINTDRALSLRLTRTDSRHPPVSHLFGLLVERMAGPLSQLHERFDVLIELDRDSYFASDPNVCREAFERILATAGSRGIGHFHLVVEDRDFAVINRWLDKGIQRPLLYIAAQFWPGATFDGFSESAAVFLIGATATAGRSVHRSMQRMPEIAWLHRPMYSSIAELDGDLSQVVAVQADAPVASLWHTGFQAPEHRVLLAAARAPHVVLRPEEGKGEHRLDDAIGKPGAFSARVALALAVEAVGQGYGQQLVTDYNYQEDGKCTLFLVAASNQGKVG